MAAKNATTAVKGANKSLRPKKKNKLRYNEYYDIQDVFDKLYKDSKENKIFTNLIDLILDDRNIKLAYRNIKRNTGSVTAGTNGHTMEVWANSDTEQYINYVKGRLENYTPHKVRRVEIPKTNGKIRPLGIPTVEDRLIQQCIKQVLEPICEAKFHPNNYGYRPNRGVKEAVAKFMHLINFSQLFHVVDVDIKGFFDNVDHGKLLKQIWAMGIRDKQLICIISKMLKAEIENVGKPTKGTPQGGILSPLLSNIVLNEFDWWISNQWETFETVYPYVGKRPNGDKRNDSRYKALREHSTLKEVYIVRYADDFKLICRSAEIARKMYIATEKWLKERLNLEISPEKSKIADIRVSSSEFLGFRFKAKPKRRKYVAISHMTEKAKNNCIERLISRVIDMKKHTTVQTVMRYNSTVLGMQNYYQTATHVNLDFGDIAYRVDKVINNRLKQVKSSTGNKGKSFDRLYKNNYKIVYVAGLALFPIHDIQHKIPLMFKQEICNYTPYGRSLIHDKLKNYDESIMHYIMENPVEGKSLEYNDNRVSLYVGQYGNCGITGEPLIIGEMETHHKKRTCDGGTDGYSNLIMVTSDVHKLIHATDNEIIEKYCRKVKPKDAESWNKMLKKINTLRKKAGNFVIK